MDSDDQTALLPRQPAPRSPHRHHPRTDAWERGPRARVQVDGALDGRRQALSTLARTLPTILMAALGLIRLAWPSLDPDELRQWDSATDPYSIVLTFWAKAFGVSDFALRLPSLLAMTVAAGLVATLGTRLAGPRVGLLAGLLFALLPATSRYAQQVGPQALATCLAVLATLALVEVFDRPRLWRFAGYAAVAGLLGLTGAPALPLLVAHGVTVVLVRGRVLAGWLAAIMPASLAGGLIGGLPTIRFDLPARELFGTELVAGLMIGLGLLSFSLRRPAVVFTAWALIPILVLRPPDLLVTLPAWALLVAQALDRVPTARGIGATAVAALLCVPAQVDIRQRDGHGQDAIGLAAVLAVQAQPGDAIVYGPTPEDARIGQEIVARYVPSDRRPTACATVDGCSATAVWLLNMGTVVPDHGRSWTFTGLTLTRLGG